MLLKVGIVRRRHKLQLLPGQLQVFPEYLEGVVVPAVGTVSEDAVYRVFQCTFPAHHMSLKRLFAIVSNWVRGPRSNLCTKELARNNCTEFGRGYSARPCVTT